MTKLDWYRASANLDALGRMLTNRSDGLFSADVQALGGVLRDRIGRKRILVIGGGGSIGLVTAMAIARYSPQCLHVIDQDENALVELVRDFRSGPDAGRFEEFRTWALDFGSREMRALIGSQQRYHAVLNLAAVKHVRSEKDAIAALHMLDTNVLKPTKLYRWLGAAGGVERYFAVSTDKAADPVNLMGASKRLMEETLFSDRIAGAVAAGATTARFPNVAFSRGSLLEGFLHRLEKRQPLAYPPEARRYFVSLRDAADICLLAAFCAAPGTITVPAPTADLPLLSLRDAATRLLRHFDLVPNLYPDEVAARAAIEADLDHGRYPVVETSLDTTGEREMEHFVGTGEVVVPGGFRTLSALRPASARDGAVARCLARLERLRRCRSTVDKQVIVDEVMKAVPSFTHNETGRDLDQQI